MVQSYQFWAIVALTMSHTSNDDSLFGTSVFSLREPAPWVNYYREMFFFYHFIIANSWIVVATANNFSGKKNIFANG